MSERMHSHIGCICLIFLHYMVPQRVFPHGCKVALTALIRFFLSMFEHMYFEIVSLDACKVTLVAPVLLFSSVCFQMRPQMTCLRGCKVTLVAFVWLFSTMCPQMSIQSAYISNIITLVALVKLFSLVCSSHRNLFIGFDFIQQMLSKILIHRQQKTSDVSCVILI